jgi:hypothetical protein
MTADMANTAADRQDARGGAACLGAGGGAAAVEPPRGGVADRPVCGYVRADSRTTDRDLAQSVSDLAVFAAGEGRELSTVIVEWTDDARAAFDAAATELAGIAGIVKAGPAGPADLVTNRGPALMACAHAGRS